MQSNANFSNLYAGLPSEIEHENA
jgi:hypothetical protein